MAEATPLPPEGILSVVDVKGTILARKPAMQDRVGKKLWNPQVIEAVLTSREGVLEAEAEDGIAWLLAHEVVTQNPDGAFPLRVMVTVPLRQVFAEANRALVRDLLGISLATLFLLVGAWLRRRVVHAAQRQGAASGGRPGARRRPERPHGHSLRRRRAEPARAGVRRHGERPSAAGAEAP
jgi:hypothetical protein